MDRRSFIGGALALGSLGCGGTRGLFARRPNLRFGVVSDIHVTTPDSVGRFVAALEYFRDRDVDAVMVPGDLTDWGLLSGLKSVADAWYRVFPGDRAPDGRRVEKLFITGNHDFDGWWYGDMTMEMHALGYSEDEALTNLGLAGCWREVFGEDWAPIRRRQVKGYDFISAEWNAYGEIPGWMAKHGRELDPSKPFFYFTHPPILGTTLCTTAGECDGGAGRKALAAYPNAFAVSGHCHWTFNDERSLWQDEFTALEVPSLSYTSVPSDYENGSARRNGTATNAMPVVPTRLNLQEAQGCVISVYDGEIVVERRDFQRDVSAGADWVLPWPPARGKPFLPATRRAALAVPQFPSGAVFRTYTANTENRQGKWEIVMMCEFPAAVRSEADRAFDYEVRAELEDGTVALVKRFLSPAFHLPVADEPRTMAFYFDVRELPQAVRYRLTVRPRNSYGVAGRPLCDGWRKGAPGLATYRKMAVRI